MSRQAAAEFLMRVRSDSGLKDKLGPNPTPESYVNEGSQLSLNFSVDELGGAINAERLYNKAKADPALMQRLAAAEDEAAVLALSREEGLECRHEDLQAVLRPQSGELSDADLEQAAGGVNFSLALLNKSVFAPPAFAPIPYPRI